MKKSVVYIHGKGGNADEAEHYKPLFKGYDVIGFDYNSESPWEAKKEFPLFFSELRNKYDKIILIANSIGAYYSISSLSAQDIDKIFLISPIVDMEKLILNMMKYSGITENQLESEKEIPTDFGETLSWEYLTYIRENPTQWNHPAYILYGSNDNMTSYETIKTFAENTNSQLTVMQNGEHWFHTEEQMKFLDFWIENIQNKI